MGTPDLRGTQGTFAYYTDDPDVAEGSVPGGRIVRADLSGGHAELRVEGPPNSLRRDHRIRVGDAERRYRSGPAVRATRRRRRDGDRSRGRMVGMDARRFRADSASGVRARDVSGFRAPASSALGALRFSSQCRSHVARSADLRAAGPSAGEIARHIGRYSTLGIPEDTSALRQGVFNLQEFLSQSRLVLNDERKLLQESLNRFHGGFLFFYFSSVDQNSHVLWGHHEAELLGFYRAVDACNRRSDAAEAAGRTDGHVRPRLRLFRSRGGFE